MDNSKTITNIESKINLKYLYNLYTKKKEIEDIKKIIPTIPKIIPLTYSNINKINNIKINHLNQTIYLKIILINILENMNLLN